MVCGGAYGTEDIVRGWGYGRALIILALTPLIWALPVSLMVGELSSSLPAEGGFYAWVRAGVGDFWGFQEAWLSLAASIFDMAIYPALFIAYLERLAPWVGEEHHGLMIGLAMIVVCTALNLAGIHTVGITSFWLFLVISGPFALIVLMAPFKAGMLAHAASPPVTTSVGLLGGTLVAMWNYMGWDNASTVAQEVEDPQRNYPRAMVAAAALAAVTYILPLAAMAVAGLSVSSFSTGDWMTAANALAGPWLGLAVVAGGVLCGVGMFNALMLSYTRLPMAMAEDGMLPSAFARRNRRGVPWVSVLLCGLAWALALKLPFERLISIDLILYGTSLMLEFVALIVLRIREPEMKRPFRAGNLPFACALSVGPAVLLGYAIYAARGEKLMGSVSALLFAVVVALLGPLLYWLTAVPLARRRPVAMPAPE